MSLHGDLDLVGAGLADAASAGWTLGAMGFSCGVCSDRRLARGDAQVLQRERHRMHGLLHFVAADRADTAYAKSLDLCELARIEDEAARSRAAA